MTDLTERLRAFRAGDDPGVAVEAADEIERLRAAIGKTLQRHEWIPPNEVRRWGFCLSCARRERPCETRRLLEPALEPDPLVLARTYLGRGTTEPRRRRDEQ